MGSTKNYEIAQLDQIPAVKCPCGFSRRAFVSPDNPVVTIHMVDIQTDARTHYHKKLTEIYLILDVEGEGFMELDGELIPVKPMTSIFIKPGCRHRAVGKMRIVNIPVPAFDPNDEWFDDDVENATRAGDAKAQPSVPVAR
jgi:mannose-6-phosphate isomerase-like protein (cupin superfamily)